MSARLIDARTAATSFELTQTATAGLDEAAPTNVVSGGAGTALGQFAGSDFSVGRAKPGSIGVGVGACAADAVGAEALGTGSLAVDSGWELDDEPQPATPAIVATASTAANTDARTDINATTSPPKRTHRLGDPKTRGHHIAPSAGVSIARVVLPHL